MATWPATTDHIDAIRHIRGLADTDPIEEMDRAAAIGEIKAAMAEGFDFRAWTAARQDPAPTSRKSSTCDECGTGSARHSRADSSGIHGKVCYRCRHIPSAELSFA